MKLCLGSVGGSIPTHTHTLTDKWECIKNLIQLTTLYSE